MSDETDRELERQVKADPSDVAVVRKLATAKVRAGSEVTRQYKIRSKDGLYLSGSGDYYQFTKVGKIWKSEKLAILAAYEASKARYGGSSVERGLSDASLVEFWWVDMASRPLKTSLKVAEMNQIQKQKELLMQQLKDLETKETTLKDDASQ